MMHPPVIIRPSFRPSTRHPSVPLHLLPAVPPPFAPPATGHVTLLSCPLCHCPCFLHTTDSLALFCTNPGHTCGVSAMCPAHVGKCWRAGHGCDVGGPALNEDLLTGRDRLAGRDLWECRAEGGRGLPHRASSPLATDAPRCSPAHRGWTAPLPAQPCPSCSLGSTLSSTARTASAWRGEAASSASPRSAARGPPLSARRTARTWSRGWTSPTPAAMSPSAVRRPRGQGAVSGPGVSERAPLGTF